MSVEIPAHSFIRALLVSYLHDCCHCLYFSMSPSFWPAEIDINLPCDDGLWNAGSAMQWFQTAKSPSQYRFARLSGFSMQRALAILSEPQPTTLPVLNSFSHFILIHAILQSLYTSHSNDQLDNSSLVGCTIDGKGGTTEIQRTLHTWLQMWMNNPDAIRYDNSREEPPFVYNALPFYWLAQALLVMFRNEGVDLKLDCKNQSWYRLMKEWLDKIKSHLRNGTQVPTYLWDELMNIRFQIQQRPEQGRTDHPGGLASFFQRDV